MLLLYFFFVCLLLSHLSVTNESKFVWNPSSLRFGKKWSCVAICVCVTHDDGEKKKIVCSSLLRICVHCFVHSLHSAPRSFARGTLNELPVCECECVLSTRCVYVFDMHAWTKAKTNRHLHSDLLRMNAFNGIWCTPTGGISGPCIGVSAPVIQSYHNARLFGEPLLRLLSV